jgi:hypothetical protein
VSDRLPVGQVAVSDLGGAAASGYGLLAASPLVAAADADFLTARPQVSDHLHTADEPGPYFSFHRLPSGAWAFSRRFVAGRRRGAFNRIVVHTLLLDRRALAAVGEEPWLLLAADRFATAGGALGLGDLDAALADPALRSLDDLELLPPADPQAERRDLLLRRRDLLAERWGGEALARRLAWALASLEAGRRVLLPQGREGENLVALAASALPARDRTAAGFTTHLGPGAGDLVLLAAAPRPAEARREQGRPDEWLVPEEPVDAAGGGAELAAALLAADAAGLLRLYGGLRTHRLSLLADGGNLRRWLVGRGLLDPQGYAEPAALAAALHELRLAPGERLAVPGLSAADVLAPVAATARRAVAAGQGLDEAVAAAWQALDGAGLADDVARPEAVLDLAGQADAPTVAVAVALVLRRHAERARSGWGGGARGLGTFPSRPLAAGGAGSRAGAEPRAGAGIRGGAGPALPRRAAAADAPRAAGAGLSSLPAAAEPPGELVDALRRADPGPGDSIFSAVLGELARVLVAAGSPGADRVLPRLARESGGLDRLRHGLGDATPELPVVLSLIEAARRAGDEATAQRFAAVDLVARLEIEPEAPAADAERCAAAVPLLRSDVDSWVEALRRTEGAAHRLLVADLGRWLAEAPEPARRAAAAAAEEEAAVRPGPEVHGLSAALAAAGAPPAEWLPFAVAEARRLDTGAEAHRLAAFERFLATASSGDAMPRDTARTETADSASASARPEIAPSPAAGASAAGGRFLAALAREGAAGHAVGVAHRRLAERLLPDLVGHGERVAPALAVLERVGWDELAAWAPLVHRLGDLFEDGGDSRSASEARRAWWHHAAQREDWAPLPEEAPAMLQALAPDDLAPLVGRLLPQVRRLGDGAVEDELVRALVERAPAASRFDVELARLVREVRLARRPLDLALTDAEEAARGDGGDAARRRTEAVRLLLPRGARDRFAVLCDLLASPRLWPATKLHLEDLAEDQLLGGPGAGPGLGSEGLGGGLAAALPPLAVLAARPRVLLAAGRALGRRWREEPARAAGRFGEALAVRRYDFAAAFLAGTEESRDRRFLRWLERDGDPAVARALERALRDPLARWSLGRWAGRFEEAA